ncbi:MAG: ATP-binding protein [Enterocloster clostridioformis]
MVKHFLTLTALEFGNDMPVMERFDIAALIHGILLSAGILLQQKEARVVFDLQEEPVWVWADEFAKIGGGHHQLPEQCHEPPGGGSADLKVELGKRRKEKEVRITAVPQHGAPYTGGRPGNAFGPKFYVADKARSREYGGSGIGLSIVKAIMDSHNKSCGVENVNGGVEFWFTVDSGI